jgi:hypothetical protein
MADVLRRYGAAFRQAHAPSLAQERVMTAIESCRTARLGGHVDQCDTCGHQRISYNSCRNRHCPKCQGKARANWLEKRQAELLPVPYFHVVFTLPEPLRPVALQNKRTLYDILFRATSQTLLTIAKDPKHLGASIGFFAVLHTWGQNLLDHPHLHCVVPAGGLSQDRQHWTACRKNFFLPVRVLSRLFRRLFLEDLKAAFEKGDLSFHGSLTHLCAPETFARLLADARGCEWIVYAKPPFGGPQQVLRYLARYANRIALSNDRILDIQNGKVTFSWKDYRHGHRRKTMTLPAPEFIRRFLLHVIPDRFVRIRHFGLLANRHRTKNLDLCRKLLTHQQNTNPSRAAPSSPPEKDQDTQNSPDPLCPGCHQGHMRQIQILPPVWISLAPFDSS